MKLTYTSRDGRMVAEFEDDTQTGLFEQLAAFQEVFEDNTCVAKIKGNVVTSDLTRFVVRENKDGDKFYEKYCSDWDKNLVGFKKSFGCRKKGGGLFPKDMPEVDRIPGLNGWHKYTKDTKETKEVKQEAGEGSPF